jgi:hypothetical protein
VSYPDRQNNSAIDDLTAKVCADAVKMMAIRHLLEMIEVEFGEVLLADALDAAHARVRDDGWKADQNGVLYFNDIGRPIARAIGIDTKLADEIFRPCRFDLFVEALRDFRVAHHRLRRKANQR